MMSPGSSVMKRERSATSSPNGKIRFAVESSCTTSPLTSARSGDRAGVDVSRGDRRTDRREAVVPLGHDVRAAIVPAHVVHADVVRRRVPADVVERALERDVPRRAPDDQRDLGLERQQLHALRADDRVAVTRDRRGRLEEVRRLSRPAPSLGRTALVVEVHPDDLGWRGRRHRSGSITFHVGSRVR